MITFLLEQQGSHNLKILVFPCYPNRRAKKEHWARKKRPPTNIIKQGKNIISIPLVGWKNITLPQTHIKLKLNMKFVSVVECSKHCFGFWLHTYAQYFLDLALKKSKDI